MSASGGRRRGAATRGLQRSRARRRSFVLPRLAPLPLVAALPLLVALACSGGDPAVAPLVARGTASIELGLVAGELAAPAGAGDTGGGARHAGATGATSACGDTVATGFPEAVRVQLVVVPSSSTPLEREFQIAAGAATGGIVVDGLPPGGGYRFQATVRRQADGEVLFAGSADDQVVRSGGRTLIRIDLAAVGRRLVLAVGASRSISDTEVAVPILASHTQSLRGLQFDLCFDTALVEITGLTATGRLADFDGVAGGLVQPDGPYRIVLWSADAARRLPPGQDAVLELSVRFLPGSEAAPAPDLVFGDTIATDDPDPAHNFAVYFLDGRVTR